MEFGDEMTEELKPCEHCGNPAKWIQEIHQSPDSVRLGYIRCSACEIRTGSMLTKSEAIAAWNRREPIGNPDELPEWLKEKIEERIKILNKASKRYNVDINRIDELRWILSLHREDVE